MIDVELPMRLFTATHFPSGDTPSWGGSLPTAIFPTSAYGSPGFPSRTHTWPVLSEATQLRRFEQSGVGDGAGIGLGVGGDPAGSAWYAATAPTTGASAG